MKKLYSIFLLTAIAVGATAQQKPRPQIPHSAISVKASKDEVYANPTATQANNSQAKLGAPMPMAKFQKNMTLWQQVIGYTNYDNQSNASMESRIIMDDAGIGHAAWMLSNEVSTWSDRGTGYNTGVYTNWAVEPVERIEAVRTGWVDLHRTESGTEFYVCHDGSGPPKFNSRPVIGSGEWTLIDMPTAYTQDFLWPRAAVDGNTIHVIALSEPSGLDATALPLNNLDGNLVYWRSDDAGATWVVQDYFFAALDVSEYEGISSDSYAIDARDGNVSIGIFSRFHDTALLKSSDNGANWTYTIISDFAIPGYIYDSLSDSNADGIADTLFTCDATGALKIDGAGVTHVVFGSNFIIDDTPDDTFYSYFFTFDLLYWNDTYATDDIFICATAEESEIDDDEDFTIGSADEVSNYTRSLAGMPSIAEDEDGVIYIVYAGADEAFLGSQFYRHLYVVKTEDNGLSFLDPVELTPDEDEEYLEFVYPSVVEHDGVLHIVAQRDTEPGILVPEVANGASTETNDIIYIAISTDLNTDVNVGETAAPVLKMNVYPSPTSGIVNIEGENLDKQSLKIYDMSGKLMVNTTINGRDKVTFDFSFLPTGMYNLAVGSGKNKMNTEILIQK
jgi:Secretion system C-terminal sorting domain